MVINFWDEDIQVLSKIFQKKLLTESGTFTFEKTRRIIQEASPLDLKIYKAISYLSNKILESPKYKPIYDELIESIAYNDEFMKIYSLEKFKNDVMCINDYIILENKLIEDGKSKNFIQQAIEHPGKFHKWCVKQGFSKVTNECIEKGLKSNNPTVRKEAVLARTLAKERKKVKHPGRHKS